jgi:hypothetical protein
VATSRPLSLADRSSAVELMLSVSKTSCKGEVNGHPRSSLQIGLAGIHDDCSAQISSEILCPSQPSPGQPEV